MVIGGPAVLLYGEPRLTRDIDVTVGLTPSHLPRVLAVVQSLGLQVLVPDVTSFVEQTWVLPTLDEATGLRVDFIFSRTPYEQSAMERARKVPLGGGMVTFASPEDVIIHKMLAGRARDEEDVRSILRKQTVDAEDIRQWLEEFDAALGTATRSKFESLWEEVQAEAKQGR